MSEPEYTKVYSNETVCNYFYYLAVIVLSLGVLSVGIHGWGLLTMKNKGVLFASLIVSVVQIGLAYYLYLFSYLICSRSLLDKKSV